MRRGPRVRHRQRRWEEPVPCGGVKLPRTKVEARVQSPETRRRDDDGDDVSSPRTGDRSRERHAHRVNLCATGTSVDDIRGEDEQVRHVHPYVRGADNPQPCHTHFRERLFRLSELLAHARDVHRAGVRPERGDEPDSERGRAARSREEGVRVEIRRRLRRRLVVLG